MISHSFVETQVTFKGMTVCLKVPGYRLYEDPAIYAEQFNNWFGKLMESYYPISSDPTPSTAIGLK